MTDAGHSMPSAIRADKEVILTAIHCVRNTVKVIQNALEPHNDTFGTEESVNQLHHFHIDDILRIISESSNSNEVDIQNLVVTIGTFDIGLVVDWIA